MTTGAWLAAQQQEHAETWSKKQGNTVGAFRTAVELAGAHYDEAVKAGLLVSDLYTAGSVGATKNVLLARTVVPCPIQDGTSTPVFNNTVGAVRALICGMWANSVAAPSDVASRSLFMSHLEKLAPTFNSLADRMGVATFALHEALQESAGSMAEAASSENDSLGQRSLRTLVNAYQCMSTADWGEYAGSKCSTDPQ